MSAGLGGGDKFDRLYGHEREYRTMRDAAPDLYAALSALFEASRIHDPDDWTGEPAMCAAQAALRKARGDTA